MFAILLVLLAVVAAIILGARVTFERRMEREVDALLGKATPSGARRQLDLPPDDN